MGQREDCKGLESENLINITIVPKNMARRFYLLSDIWSFMKERKKWWLLPIVIMLILVGILIVVGQSSSLSPFIYALF